MKIPLQILYSDGNLAIANKFRNFHRCEVVIYTPYITSMYFFLQNLFSSKMKNIIRVADQELGFQVISRQENNFSTCKEFRRLTFDL